MRFRRLVAAWLVLCGIAMLAWAVWPRLPVVEVIEIRRAPATRVLAVNGNIRPRLSVAVQAPVSGTLTALSFDVGARVQAGALLARVDDAPQRAAIREAEAAVATQRATLAQARRDLARFEALGDFTTRQRREQARLAVDEGNQELQRRLAAVTQAREVRARYELRAPFSGIILERPVDPGQTIGADTVIYRLADLTTPEVTAEVDEIYAAELGSGAAALVTLPDRPAPLRARIVHIEPRVDRATGAREVRLRIVDPLATAPAGLTVAVTIIVDRVPAAISIPRSIILQPESNPHVRALDTAGRVEDRPIRFIDWPAASVIVTQGLQPGMRVLADPAAASPGMRVRPRG